MTTPQPETFTDVIDRAIKDFGDRKLLANAEVVDALLDMRLSLSGANPAFLGVIDRAMDEFRDRKLLANAEVMDVLLDVRLAVVGPDLDFTFEPTPAPEPDFSSFGR